MCLVYTRYIPGLEIQWYIPGIYLVYTSYIAEVGIYQVYTRYIPGKFHFWRIQMIFRRAWLRERGRVGWGWWGGGAGAACCVACGGTALMFLRLPSPSRHIGAALARAAVRVFNLKLPVTECRTRKTTVASGLV